MDDVFISYARETSAVARAAADALRKSGHSVWLDEQLPAHRDYAQVIAERIDAAKAVLVIWSTAATRSQWVRSEATRGRERGTLVQLRIDDTRLPMPFDQIQCVDLTGWAGDATSAGWRIVQQSIDDLAGADAAQRSPSPAAAPPAGRSVAVLPFKDLSPSQDQGYFCDGISEEILMALARLPRLRVASSATLADADVSIGSRRIAEALGVKTFLEGSVRKAGDRARVAVRLVETSSAFSIWAESFDRDLSDIFELQDEIARSVVAALGLKLLAAEAPASGPGTANPAAHDLYLRARHLMRKELESERRGAAELFREATRRDSGFALAYAGLADVLADIARSHVSGWQAAEQEAIECAERAVALAPELAEAHLAKGAALRLRRDPAARQAYERAVQLSPNDPAVHYRFARFLVLEGEKRAAIRHYERAFELAPDDYRYVVYTLQEYQALQDAAGERFALGRSWEAIDRHLQINPDDVRALGHGAGVLALLKRHEDAERFIQRALDLRPDDYGNLATLACGAMLNGDADQALNLLERAVATGRGDKEWLLQDNDLVPLHGDPRFEALVATMN